MHKFNLLTENSDGHLIIESSGQRMLIDTGSDVSLGYEATLPFLGDQVALQQDKDGVTVEDIIGQSGLGKLGVKVDILLGMDVLAKYNLFINYDDSLVSFVSDCTDSEGMQVDMKHKLGLPTIVPVINGTSVTSFLDTGAKLCYFDKGIVRKHPFVREEMDFYPGLGSFVVKVHDVPVTLAGETMAMACGVVQELPGNLSTALSAGGVGIVGTELFKYFDACLFFSDSLLKLNKVRNEAWC